MLYPCSLYGKEYRTSLYLTSVSKLYLVSKLNAVSIHGLYKDHVRGTTKSDALGPDAQLQSLRCNQSPS